jgi:hypothetical protein
VHGGLGIGTFSFLQQCQSILVFLEMKLNLLSVFFFTLTSFKSFFDCSKDGLS